MKNKKGFTLIEIIICIAMLAIIAVGRFVGIYLVNKNLTGASDNPYVINC